MNGSAEKLSPQLRFDIEGMASLPGFRLRAAEQRLTLRRILDNRNRGEHDLLCRGGGVSAAWKAWPDRLRFTGGGRAQPAGRSSVKRPGSAAAGGSIRRSAGRDRTEWSRPDRFLLSGAAGIRFF